MKRNALLAFNALVYLFILAPVLVVIPISFSATHNPGVPTARVFAASDAILFHPGTGGSALAQPASRRLDDGCSDGAGHHGGARARPLPIPGPPGGAVIAVSPLVMPRLVLGIALLMFLSKTVLSGQFGELLVAHIVVAFPYVVRTVSASLFGARSVTQRRPGQASAPPR